MGGAVLNYDCKVATGQFGIAAEAAVGKYGKIANLPRRSRILYAFAYAFAMFAASPAPIMGGGLRPPPQGGRPKWVLGRRQT